MLEDSASSGRSSSTSAVNQPLPGEQAMPPALPVMQEAANRALPYPYQNNEIIGGDSVESIQRRLLGRFPSPSAHEIQMARIEAEDLFEVKVDICQVMAGLHPSGDWMGRGARALDNLRTATGEESLSKLLRMREDLQTAGLQSATFRQLADRDPLLKLNHANVMEVPGSCEIRVVPKAPYDFIIKNGKLAMEIPRGQKFIQTQRGSTGKSFRSNPFLGSNKDKGYVSDLARQSTLRGHGMSNFSVRISTVMSLLDSPVEIRENSIQFSMETEFCEFSPELEDHFEIFEHIRGFNVTIVTSANTQDETLPPWSGFLQKDEGETQNRLGSNRQTNRTRVSSAAGPQARRRTVVHWSAGVRRLFPSWKSECGTEPSE
ncbi:hypothetical protein JHK82_057419 (mitochondrion) [Glycine max]|nr:hypothetical protein JHK85_056284 [Glycine max]KAG4936248.1 hypothetical protein JHK85_051167 [Glycine max]KAG5076077.1 hypothetical protein JHK82_057419 [Glycine max]